MPVNTGVAGLAVGVFGNQLICTLDEEFGVRATATAEGTIGSEVLDHNCHSAKTRMDVRSCLGKRATWLTRPGRREVLIFEFVSDDAFAYQTREATCVEEFTEKPRAHFNWRVCHLGTDQWTSYWN